MCGSCFKDTGHIEAILPEDRFIFGSLLGETGFGEADYNKISDLKSKEELEILWLLLERETQGG